MADIGDKCDICEEGNCERCVFGNPCLNCADYKVIGESGMGICMSNGGCGKYQKEGEADGCDS